jgi:formylmethanofuran dehydrogenase subunit D
MCQRCEWSDAVERAKAVATAQPEWKTKSVEFFESVAETIEEMEHVTPRQLEVIEEGEEQVEE